VRSQIKLQIHAMFTSPAHILKIYKVICNKSVSTCAEKNFEAALERKSFDSPSSSALIKNFIFIMPQPRMPRESFFMNITKMLPLPTFLYKLYREQKKKEQEPTEKEREEKEFYLKVGK